MSKVNRSVYQRVEENKKLLADIRTLVMDGMSAKGVLCRGKWKDKFEADKEMIDMIKAVVLNGHEYTSYDQLKGKQFKCKNHYESLGENLFYFGNTGGDMVNVCWNYDKEADINEGLASTKYNINHVLNYVNTGTWIII